MGLPPEQGIEENLYGAGPGENGQPVEDGEGEKMGSAVIGYYVAAAAHYVFFLLYCGAVGFSTHVTHGTRWTRGVQGDVQVVLVPMCHMGTLLLMRRISIFGSSLSRLLGQGGLRRVAAVFDNDLNRPVCFRCKKNGGGQI